VTKNNGRASVVLYRDGKHAARPLKNLYCTATRRRKLLWVKDIMRLDKQHERRDSLRWKTELFGTSPSKCQAPLITCIQIQKGACRKHWRGWRFTFQRWRKQLRQQWSGIWDKGLSLPVHHLMTLWSLEKSQFISQRWSTRMEKSYLQFKHF